MSLSVVREIKLFASATPFVEALQRFATVGVLAISPFIKKNNLFLIIGPPKVKPYVVLRSTSRAPGICFPLTASPRKFSFL